MIIPSIDLSGGRAVQLIGGREMALDGGDPVPLAARFGRVGEIAVVDLDAAIRGDHSQAPVVDDLLTRARCRVGGGIRTYERARDWLDRGAHKIVLGTAAQPELLRRLPRDRTIAALDVERGEVMVEGWRRGSGAQLEDRIDALRPYVGGFLVTVIEREGRMAGADLELAERLADLTGDVPLTYAGGVTSADEVRVLDRLGVDAQVGMALYRGDLPLADAFAAPLTSDREDGLWPTVVCDEHGRALGLCWSNLESLTTALDTGRGVYWSRRRGLWHKGATSGATQELLAVDLDCDRDALRFTVRQHGPGFCHAGTATCFGEASGLAALERTVAARCSSAPASSGSYTARLLGDPELLAAKLTEEARELVEARTPDQVTHEAADVLFFTQVAMARAGVTRADVARELDRRALRVSRRPGDAKPPTDDAQERQP